MSDLDYFLSRFEETGLEILKREVSKKDGDVNLEFFVSLTKNEIKVKVSAWFSEKLDQTIVTLFLQAAGLQGISTKDLLLEKDVIKILNAAWQGQPYVIFKKETVCNSIIAMIMWCSEITKEGARLPDFLSPEQAMDIIFSNRI